MLAPFDMTIVVLSVVIGLLAVVAGALAMAYVLEKQRRLQAEAALSQAQAGWAAAREQTLEQRGAAVEHLVAPLQQALKQMDDRLEGIERSRIAMTSSLTEQLKQLGSAHESLRVETGALARALRQPSARGRWGELQLKRVAELAGMLEHCDFEQQAQQTGAGIVQRPDMIVSLPQGRRIAVDAKVPLSAFLEAEEAPTDELRRLKLREHAKALRGHVQALAKRAYWDQLQPSPELVVLFLPGEHFYAAALSEDPSLLEIATLERVIIATPTTLIALLKAVSFGWQQERIAENARYMADLGRELTKRLGDALTHTSNLGKLLGRAVEGYNRVVGSFEARVMPAARRLAESSGAGAGPESLELVDTLARRGGSNDIDQDLPSLFAPQGKAAASNRR